MRYPTSTLRISRVDTGTTGRTFAAEPVVCLRLSGRFGDCDPRRSSGQLGCSSMARDSADAYFFPDPLARHTSIFVRQGSLCVSQRKGSELGHPGTAPSGSVRFGSLTKDSINQVGCDLLAQSFSRRQLFRASGVPSSGTRSNGTPSKAPAPPASPRATGLLPVPSFLLQLRGG